MVSKVVFKNLPNQTCRWMGSQNDALCKHVSKVSGRSFATVFPVSKILLYILFIKVALIADEYFTGSNTIYKKQTNKPIAN